MTIGERLIKARVALGLTQPEAATGSGIPKSSLQKYEGDHSPPGAVALQGLAKLGIDIHWLLTGEGEMLTQGGRARVAAEKTVNRDALQQAIAAIFSTAPKGEDPNVTAGKAVAFYLHLLDTGMITLDGVGHGNLGQVA